MTDMPTGTCDGGGEESLTESADRMDRPGISPWPVRQDCNRNRTEETPEDEKEPTMNEDTTYRPDGTGCTWEELLAACAEGRRATITADDRWTITGLLWPSSGHAWGVGPVLLEQSEWGYRADSFTVHDVPVPLARFKPGVES